MEYDFDTSTREIDVSSNSDTSCSGSADKAREKKLDYDGTII